eukprot:TRINITY_DN4974_c0_g1_i1.p1 TRINITY_DN4974_c0_g1~~TRINITY_DN4974_c0_g1_i1.p1  ORF type:complete len:493 (+),score=45.82 TRINITY_DN4974_c0_g1_i1:29-1507(+)
MSWEYQDDRGDWQRYDAETNQKIESAIEATLTVRISGADYQIDKGMSRQINVRTKKPRRIRRLALPPQQIAFDYVFLGAPSIKIDLHPTKNPAEDNWATWGLKRSERVAFRFKLGDLRGPVSRWFSPQIFIGISGTTAAFAVFLGPLITSSHPHYDDISARAHVAAFQLLLNGGFALLDQHNELLQYFALSTKGDSGHTLASLALKNNGPPAASQGGLEVVSPLWGPPRPCKFLFSPSPDAGFVVDNTCYLVTRCVPSPPKRIPEEARRLDPQPYSFKRSCYIAETGQWQTDDIVLRKASVPFAAGALREAFYCELADNSRWVVKRQLPPEDQKVYWEDAMAQSVAEFWARQYNSRMPPKRISFLQAYVLHDESRVALFALEPFVDGEYLKHNSNFGGVAGFRATPQAFSHFTYEVSNRMLMVVDIQGVNDAFTDPQIHTPGSTAYFGLGNLGQQGVDEFLKSHHCNDICRHLGLQPYAPQTNTLATCAPSR